MGVESVKILLRKDRFWIEIIDMKEKCVLLVIVILKNICNKEEIYKMCYELFFSKKYYFYIVYLVEDEIKVI